MSAVWIVLFFLPLQEETPAGVTPIPGPNQQAIPSPQVPDGPRRQPDPIAKTARLSPEAIDEIRNIRERIGIQLFENQSTDREFARQLEQLDPTPTPAPWMTPRRHQPVPPGPQVEPGSIRASFPKIAAAQGAGSASLSVPHPSGTKRALKPHENRGLNLQQVARQTLLEAVGNLDRVALELERSGEFTDSGKLRKLSRKIRKQARKINNQPDN